MATTSYSSAPLGSTKRTSDLLSAAKSMISQTKAQGSTPYAGSSYAKEYQASSPTAQVPVIPVSETTVPVPKLELPTPTTTPTNFNDILTQANLQLGLSPQGQQITQKTTGDNVPTQGQSFLESLGIVTPKPENLSDAYTQAREQAGIADRQQKVNTLSFQIADITNRATANQLAVTGQGRGIPEVIIGGQQAQIAKEAAIQVLPLQAQLAAAQGDLELAQNNLDTWFKVKSQDIQNNYNYAKDVADKIYNWASDQQKAKLDELKTQKAQDFEREMVNLKFQQDKYIKNMGLQADAGGVVTLTGKPQNATQSAANSYANRLNESNVIISNLGSKFTGSLSFGGVLPNILQSGDRQAYEQSKRNFITAILRRESGAAISPTEFDTAEKQYFPQAGDKPSTVAQKEISRNTVINNFYREANVQRPVLPGMTIQSNGKRYRVDLDGETLTEI